MVLLAILLAVYSPAMAYKDPVKVTIDLSQSSFTGPQEIDVGIQVSNTSDADLPGPMTLYYPDGRQVEEFGSPTLTAGTKTSCTVKWNVTQEQLDAGKIIFELHYSITGDEGEVIKKHIQLVRLFSYSGGVASIKVDRTILPTTAASGQNVSITYTIVNTGTLPVTNVEISENKSISTEVGKIASIAPGEKATYTFTVKMQKKNLTSKATVTYLAKGETNKEESESAVIKYGDIKLKSSLKADKKGGMPGDMVKLTLTLQNTDKTDFTNVSVSDPVLGEVFTGQTVPAGKTVTLERDITIVDTASYQFVIHATQASGGDIETATELLTVKAVEPSDLIRLSVEASADHDVIYTMPGIVKFTVSVTNESAADVKNVSVGSSGITLYTFDSLLSGETRSFVRDVKVETVGRFQFTASARDQLDEVQTFESNIVPIAYSAPTPSPTEVPIERPIQPIFEPIPSSVEIPASYDHYEQILRYAYYVFLAIACAAGALALFAIVRKAIIYAGRPKDRLDVSSIRNYNEPAEDAQPADEEAEQKKTKSRASNRSIGDEPDDSDLPTESETALAAKEQDEPDDGEAE